VMRYHIAQSIRGLLRTPKRLWPDMFQIDGHSPSLREIQREVGLALNKGFEVIPPCNNVDARGMCAGHEEDPHGT